MDRRRGPGPRRYFARQRLTVILFARTVVLGRGKRRLAKDIGDLNAWRFYRGALQATIGIVGSDPRWSCIAAIDPPTATKRPGPMFCRGPGRRFERRGQVKGTLGRRMLSALNDAPPGPAILIGSDIQGLNTRSLMRGLLACNAADIVLGPADDGGFWLIGSKKVISLQLLEKISWSQPSTLHDVQAELPKAWRSRLVDRLHDVDDFEDLIQAGQFKAFPSCQIHRQS